MTEVEVIGVIAGLVGILGVGIGTLERLDNIYRDYHDHKNVEELIHELKDRLHSLKEIEKNLSKSSKSCLTRDEQKSAQKLAERFSKKISKLKDIYTKIGKPPESEQACSCFGGPCRKLRLAWKQSKIQQLWGDIDHIQGSLQPFINIANLIMASEARKHQIQNDIPRWLDAPIPTQELDRAHESRTAETGTWLLEHQLYQDWFRRKDSSYQESSGPIKSFLWINGKLGCGKTVLCSTIIESLKGPKWGQQLVLFYFFTCRDDKKRHKSGLLRALLWQLAQNKKTPNGKEALSQLYGEKSFEGQPSNNDLLQTLQVVLGKVEEHVYIIIDALDESLDEDHPSNKEILDLVRDIPTWNLGKIHLLVTGRDDPHIRNYLSLQSREILYLESTSINSDIELFVNSRLQRPEFKKFEIYKSSIKQRLLESAHGS